MSVSNLPVRRAGARRRAADRDRRRRREGGRTCARRSTGREIGRTISFSNVANNIPVARAAAVRKPSSRHGEDARAVLRRCRARHERARPARSDGASSNRRRPIPTSRRRRRRWTSPGSRSRAGELRDELRFILRANEPDYVYFLETRGRGLFLRAAPIDVSTILRDVLFDRMKATVLTSATLTVEGTFDYIRSRLGLDTIGGHAVREAAVRSSTTSGRRFCTCRAGCPIRARSTSPPPRRARSSASSKRAKGRAFVLFTSYAAHARDPGDCRGRAALSRFSCRARRRARRCSISSERRRTRCCWRRRASGRAST